MNDDIDNAMRGEVDPEEQELPLPDPMARPEWPDFIGRMRAIFGDEVLEVSGAELIG